MANTSFTYSINVDSGEDTATIYLSTDKGENFVTQSVQPTIAANGGTIYANPFVISKGYYSLDDGSQIWYTTDAFLTATACGGNHTSLSDYFYAFSAASPNIIFALGDTDIVQSVDGGLTFNAFATVLSINPTAVGGDYSIYFPNTALGYVGLQDKLYVTYDLGSTWTEITTLTVSPGDSIINITGSNDGQIIVASGTSAFYVSTDAGTTWSSTVFSGSGSSNVQKYDENTYYVFENNISKRIFKSIDGGNTFSSIIPSGVTGFSSALSYIHFYTATEVIVSRQNASINRSVNGGSSFTSTLVNKQNSTSVAEYECGDCPEGYNKIGNQCVTTVITEPIQTGGSLVEVKKACGPGGIVSSCSPLYGQLGLNLMPPVDTALIPYTGFGGQVSGSDYSFRNSLNQIIFPETGYSTPSTFAVASVITNPLWQSKFSQVAVWGDGVPTNTEFCFTFCFNLLESKTYFIGIAVDNFGKIYIDNLLYFELSGSSVNIPTTPFKYWHIFPVTLSAGQHTIRMCGIDKGGPNKGIGAEVYDFPNSPDPITWFKNNCQSLTSTAPYTLFSTGDYIGEFVPDPTDPPTYRCSIDGPPITDFCSNGISCETTITIPYNPCVYQLLDCNDPENVLYTTTDVSSQIGSVVKRVGDDTCWSVIGIIDIYTMPVDITIESEFTSCAFCNPSYKLINCKDSDAVIYTTTDLSDFISPTKIIKVAEYPSECWQVGNNDKLDVEFEEITVEGEPFESCETCSPALYQLTNCYTNGSFIISDSELSSYIDSVVSLQGVPGACFTVNILNVDCLAIEALGKTAQYTTANFTGVYVDGKKQYSFTLQNIINPTDYLISWNQSLLRWEVNDITNSILIAYSVLDIINPVTDFWVREFTWNQEVTGSLSIMYCTNIIYNVSVDKVYLDCECCNNKSCD